MKNNYLIHPIVGRKWNWLLLLEIKYESMISLNPIIIIKFEMN